MSIESSYKTWKSNACVKYKWNMFLMCPPGGSPFFCWDPFQEYLGYIAQQQGPIGCQVFFWLPGRTSREKKNLRSGCSPHLENKQVPDKTPSLRSSTSSCTDHWLPNASKDLISFICSCKTKIDFQTSPSAFRSVSGWISWRTLTLCSVTWKKHLTWTAVCPSSLRPSWTPSH